MLIKLKTAIERTFEDPPHRITAKKHFEERYYMVKVGKNWYVDLERPIQTKQNDVDSLVNRILGE
tara:strand:+ start:61 stop:255 length:195 start_codon:yes stop_codon:yes gene_type:complete